MTDIRYMINSKDRKFIRNNVKHLKSGELIAIDPKNGKYGSGALGDLSVGTCVIVGIATIVCAYVGYELFTKQ